GSLIQMGLESLFVRIGGGDPGTTILDGSLVPESPGAQGSLVPEILGAHSCIIQRFYTILRVKGAHSYNSTMFWTEYCGNITHNITAILQRHCRNITRILQGYCKDIAGILLEI
ncbi:hypothetical protein PV326_007059, partial [Microctonus aethiopoides]